MNDSSGYFTSDYERDLFETRYKNPNSHEEVWEDLFERVATTVAPDADSADRFYDMMTKGRVIPSSPQLWNYGAERRFPRNGSSCFTGKMGDTLKDFRKADSDAEDIYVASGGFGLLLNDVRPRGTKIKHCSEGAMGSMCEGGPARRIEGTTGYITGSGRARGALMLQLSAWHPDAIEFILAKRPTSLGFLDDWVANARSVIIGNIGEGPSDIEELLIMKFASDWVFEKEWPSTDQVRDFITDNGSNTLSDIRDLGVLAVRDGRVIPQVYDWNLAEWRDANRDWDLPLQNCNMSIRVPDALMHAADENKPWVFHWFSPDPPKGDDMPWTKTDVHGMGELGDIPQWQDGRVFAVDEDMTRAREVTLAEFSDMHYGYGMVITTWEGLRANLAPNKNHWRDTDYARFYRTVVEPAIGHLTGKIMARQVLHLINENAWNHADPGVVFEDTYESFQPVDSAIYGPRLSNPCSEYVNSGGGSCNLASLNLRAAAEQSEDILARTRKSPSFMSVAGEYSVDWSTLRQTPAFARYLGTVEEYAQDAIEYITHALHHNVAPVDYIHSMTFKDFRTVGIGFMGLAEALMKFHVKYGSECAQNFTAATMSEIALTCWERSFAMAAEGMPKPEGWVPEKMLSIFSARADNCTEYDLPVSHVIRWRALMLRIHEGEYATHTCVTSVAPTGTISQIAGWQMTRQASNGVFHHRSVTSGVEPTFAWAVGRQDNNGSTVIEHDLWATQEHRGKPWMLTAEQVPALDHVRMQAAACAFCCMSVSKTINVPETATKMDVAEAYRLAWEMEIPGTAVYRNNSKPMQVLSALDCPSGECAVDYSSTMETATAFESVLRHGGK